MARYHWQVSPSIAETNQGDWCTVCSDPNDVAMDPRFLEAFERSFTDVSETMYLVCYDGEQQPVACACVSTFLVDGAVLTGSAHRPVINLAQKVLPGYVKFRVLFCGLPVSIGCDYLRLADGVDRNAVVDSLADQLEEFATTHRSQVIVWKEFHDDRARLLSRLHERGYLRADSLPMNTFDRGFRNLEEFCGALRSHYRYKINRSRKKFAKSGLRVEHLTDPARIESLYTPEVHKLYLAVLEQAEYKLETVPREFFLYLLRTMPGNVSLTAVFREEKVVAFAWGLHCGDTYQNIFVGVDYTLNPETDLYFNMMMCNLDYAMQSGARRILVGQSSDGFKSRLGCVGMPLSVFVKTRFRVLNKLMRLFSPWLFPAHKPAPARDLFREAAKQHQPVVQEVVSDGRG